MSIRHTKLYEKLVFFLAKFGIAEYQGQFVKTDFIYETDRDVEEDNIIIYEAVRGWKLPFFIKTSIPLMHDSKYRRILYKAVKA